MVGRGGAGRLLASRAGHPDWGSEKEPGLETDTERPQLLIIRLQAWAARDGVCLDKPGDPRPESAGAQSSEAGR